MNDNVIMENYLLVLKSNVEVFVHGTLESTYDDIQKLLKESLIDTIDSQRKTYTLMVEKNMYTIENVKDTQIKKCINKNNFVND